MTLLRYLTGMNQRMLRVGMLGFAAAAMHTVSGESMAWAQVIAPVTPASSPTILPLSVPASPISSESGVVNEAAITLQELTTGTVERIPERLLAEAYAIAIIPHAMRGAFIVGIGGGRGVLLSRDAMGRWQGPEFVTFAGGSVGWQIGVQSNDLVMVFRTPRSIENIRQGRLTLGADATVAAGPVGRYAGASTDTTLQAEILTYCRSRGLFAGVSLQGSALQLDVPSTQRFYQISSTSSGIVPASAQALVNEINRFSYTPIGFGAPSIAETSASTISVSDARILDLGKEVASLQSKLDNQWREYLALPAEWLSGRPLSVTDIQSVLIRYERVETNPMFERLRENPEFRTVLSSLRSLAQSLSGGPENLRLPPPPNTLR